MKIDNKIMNKEVIKEPTTATTEGSNPEVQTNGKEIRKEYYDNGQLKRKKSFKNGELDGLYESYYSNGQLWHKGSFKDGEQDGLWVQYDDNGQLESAESYKDGEWKGTKTKKSSVIDFTHLSLEELESQVVSLFPNEEDPEGHFHYTLMNAVIFRMVCEGWNKKELLDLVDSEFDYSTKEIAEMDKEVA